MMKFVSISFFIFFLFQENIGLNDFHFLNGTWKVEGKEQYEVWEMTSNGDLTGYTYNIVDGREIRMESIAIKVKNNQIIYEANVPGQNEGRTIQFILNPEIQSCFSYENPNHDFPKKIQYVKKSTDELFIRVLGTEDKGFSYTMNKQK